METESRVTAIPAVIRRHTSFILLLVAILSPLPTQACDDWVAKVVAVEGLVQRQTSAQDWQALKYEQKLCPGDSVRVGDNSRAALHLRNNTFARLDANSILRFPARTNGEKFWIELKQGLAHFISRIVRQFEVATPYVNAVVEGTEFIVSAQEQGTVSVVEGKVTAYNEKSRASLTAGQQATASARDQDLTRFNVPPSTVVEWAIHYPPVLSLAELPAETAQDKALIQDAITALQQNRIDQALAVLAVPQPSPVIQLARASLLLQIGRIAAFIQTIQPLLQGSHAGWAHGLNAIAAVARNDIDRARVSADEAVEQAPDKAAAWIALSYAQQAQLQLQDALNSARRAVRVQPHSVLAHLRLSELHLAQGDVDAAHKALDAVPEKLARNAELEGSKGFVQLFRLKLTSAREHFTRALAADSSNPQYHLGLGLTLLRDGDLEAGRQQMEYAVSLDPLRSVLRSYLGRAYFAEKRDGEAIKQWDLAKQFDPNDPTSYFYTGVHKLFANDPVGAIDELETSRALNDKRAIYRSETLLQSDAASRSATLARAYNEVGYSQGVLLNGWDAIRRDPTNSEGHRLLADYYAGDPRYETARVSELLQSQLWQPLSAYPLQPQLSEANLSIVAGAGPQRPSFNEYHSLFVQDGVYGMANGYGGSDGTWSNDLVGSFLTGPLALSLGQYHFESDGWRENADQEQDLYNALVQWQVSSSTSVQFEARTLQWDFGALAPEFSELVSTTERQEVDQNTYRFGIRHRITRSTTLVGNVLTQDGDVIQRDEFGGLETESSESSKGKTIEFQLVSLFSGFNIMTGAGYSNLRRGIDSSSYDAFIDPDDPTLLDVYREARLLDIEPEQRNAYVYMNAALGERVDVAAGLAYVRLDWKQDYSSKETFEVFDLDGNFLFDFPLDDISNSVDRSESYWLPKIGIGFDVAQDVYVRVAGFRTLSRYMVASQTIEPVMFFGFAQVFDDFDGTEGDNAALALDYKLSDSIWFGHTYMHRWLKYQAAELSTGSFSPLKYEESISSTQLLYTPSHRVSFSLRYVTDDRDFENRNIFIAGVDSVGRKSGVLGVEILGAHRISAGFDWTYFNQSIRVNQQSNVDKKSEWVSDLYARKRLSDRLGMVELGVKNLLDVQDEFVRYDASVLEFYPRRFWYASFNLNL